MLDKIKKGIRKARHKLARVAIGMTLAESKISYHRKRWHKFDLADENEKALFHKHKTRQWQRRQSKLRDKHIFLQTVLDRRLRKKIKYLKEHPEDNVPDHGLVTLDGHQVAAWIAEILLRARASGLWHGYVISGWRSKSYSRELCINMCGSPTCSGRCAGEYTNHVGIEEPDGATDVSDSDGLDDYLYQSGEIDRLKNDLPLDSPHYSRSGH